MDAASNPADDSFFLMTDSQRNELDKIQKKIKTVKRLIATEQEILKETPTTSYKLVRAEDSVQFHQKRLKEFKENYESTLATLEKNAARAEEALEKERNHLMNAQKSKALIRAEIELKELEQQKSLFGSPENPLQDVKPSPGFSSVSEEIAEMNRRQLEERVRLGVQPRAAPPAPPLPLASRRIRLSTQHPHRRRP
jgi:hypothetical protein